MSEAEELEGEGGDDAGIAERGEGEGYAVAAGGNGVDNADVTGKAAVYYAGLTADSYVGRKRTSVREVAGEGCVGQVAENH